MTEPESRTVWLRNDTGSDYKFPTIPLEVAAGETAAVRLWTTDAIPFGFTEVDAPATEAPASEPVNTTPAATTRRSRETTEPAPTPPAESEATS